MPQVTTQSSGGHLAMATDFIDSDSPMGSPDSCSSRSGASSACSPSSKAEKPPMVRSAANARERSRMRVLSKAFSRLKTTLPWVPADTKLSKLDTLRLASCYIAHLREILADDKPASSLPTDSAAAKAVSVTKGGNKTGGSGAQAPIHPLNLVSGISNYLTSYLCSAHFKSKNYNVQFSRILSHMISHISL